MTQDAIVTKIIDDNTAEVSVERGSACGGKCASCKGCSYKSIVKTVAVNKVSATLGDRVTLETRTSNVIGAALLVYIIPLITFFCGYAASAAMGFGEGASILTSIGALLVGVAGVALTQRRRQGVKFEIISIN